MASLVLRIKTLLYKPYSFFRKIYFKNFKTADKGFNAYSKNNNIKKLQIGCGTNILEGWLNTDIEERDKKVYYLDAGAEYPFEDNSFDYIYSEHIFEHLDITQAETMLKECYRALKPGGKFRLTTPDLAFLADIYANPDSEHNVRYVKWASDSFIPYNKKYNYNPIFVINNFHLDWGHKIIYDKESLSYMLEQFGFSDIKRYDIGESEDPVFVNIEKHGEVIPKEFNKLETMVLEGRK
jgi:Uncharacterized protein conserved in bacteria